MGDDLLVVVAVVRTLVVAGSFVVLTLKVQRPASEGSTWRSYQLGLGALLLGSVADTASRVTGHWSRPGAALLGLGTLVTTFFVYRALLHWMRARTSSAGYGRADWLLGTGSAASFTGLLLAGCALVGHPVGTVEGQLRAFHLAGLTVVVISTVVVTVSVRAGSYLRCWVATLVTAAVLAAHAHLALDPGSVAGQVLVSAAWTGLAATYAVSSLLAPTQGGSSVPSPRSVVRSAFGALGLGLAAALAALFVPSAQAGLGWAAVALVAASLRLGGFVRHISDDDRHRREARTDELTGLGNRRAFTTALDRACQDALPVAVVLLDLDRFKEVNDRHGHGVGDRLLQQTAVRLQEVVPPQGVLTRIGGDEFAVVLTDAAAASAVRTADALVAVVTGGTEGTGGIGVEGLTLDVGASAGIATSTGQDGLDGQELLRRADAAMYAAKDTYRGSGGGVTLHDDEIDRAWRGRAALAEDLRSTLHASGPLVALPAQDALPAHDGAASGFEVHYQPQLDTRTGEVVGVEALVRWRHPRLGMLAPGAFLAIVEERGLMPALTCLVARTASADLARWRAAGVRLRLSINISTSYLSNPQLLELLDEVVAAGTPARDVVVEVTETTLMHDPERALAMCHEITARGCALSIDDFGTGYSSLAYLAHLPATELKIDRSFTARALADERIAAIVAGTVELAHHLGLRTVAEGVEDEATLELLRGMGCDESQGYLHSRPVPAAELLAWVRARRSGSAPQTSQTPRTPQVPRVQAGS